MIESVSGNILESDATVLVNPVNCVGVSGAGLALQFKQAFPMNHELYAQCCKDGKVAPGFPLTTHDRDSGKVIYNFPTKRHWKDKAQLQDILSGLFQLAVDIKYSEEYQFIAMPKIGCGLGGLNWSNVRPWIVYMDMLTDCKARILLYEK